jgi:hypothetical protein
MARVKPTRVVQPTRRKRGLPGTKSPRSPAGSRLVGKNLERAVEQFQSEPDKKKAHEQWKQIETSVFGVQFED